MNKEKNMPVGGFSKAWLARAFDLNTRTVANRIHKAGIQPCGEHRKQPVYRVADVAPCLVEPITAKEEQLEGLDPDRLEPKEQLDYWRAQREKRTNAIEEGEYWSTPDLQEFWADKLRRMRDKIVQLPDTVERETGLTEKQRKIVCKISDELLEQLLEASLEEYEPAEPMGNIK